MQLFQINNKQNKIIGMIGIDDTHSPDTFDASERVEAAMACIMDYTENSDVVQECMDILRGWGITCECLEPIILKRD